MQEIVNAIIRQLDTLNLSQSIEVLANVLLQLANERSGLNLTTEEEIVLHVLENKEKRTLSTALMHQALIMLMWLEGNSND